jgi:ATP-dependent DNA helicase RecG
MHPFFDTPLSQFPLLQGGKAALLAKDANLFTYGDLLLYFPFRYEDRTTFYDIGEITEEDNYVLLKGQITQIDTVGTGEKRRMTAILRDDTGEVELVWFKGLEYVSRIIQKGVTYSVFGKPTMYGKKFNIAHPEVEVFNPNKVQEQAFMPIYNSSEKMKKRGLDSRGIASLIKRLLPQAMPHLQENLPMYLLDRYKLISKQTALQNIHFPKSQQHLRQAERRLKFEELFFIQLNLLQQQKDLKDKHNGMVLKNTQLITEFYNKHLPFALTNAQKRVLREIYEDTKSGSQMNRLLQGDVGSGKTIVAFVAALMAIGNEAQACLMAPTEILADQHYNSLKVFADKMGLSIACLTGSSKTSERRIIHEKLLSGELHLLVGTHALLEDVVQFKNLGLCIIDEQHRFGVAQRAKLWAKNPQFYPHILVMTATPIPRTLAMTVYGDLDVSVIDELPAGRKPIKTVHKYEAGRSEVFGFIRREIEKGRQAYIVYPLIEESEAMDYKNLMDGYEAVSRAFPEFPISIVHGKMKPSEKDYEMQRFLKAETKIMVATTVIEVGVNVPNASVMVIENAEKFGLSQLHQLRGRVGRGAEQSYCILMTEYKLSKDARLRLETMVRTNNGFEISEVDLKLRGPGDLSGTQQSGVLDLKIADIAKDQAVLQEARKCAAEIVAKDSELLLPEHEAIRQYIAQRPRGNGQLKWSLIS